MQDANKLVIFADYGLDDACATAYILDRRAAFETIDIVPIGGNVPVSRAARNAQKLLAAAGKKALVGVRLVDTSACKQEERYLSGIHGADGMGDLYPDVAASPVPVVPYDEWASSLRSYRVLSLGPCTLVRDALAKAPEPPCGDVVLMGGCVAYPPNYNGYEFNDALDHDAFLQVLAYPHAAATLDTCSIPAFDTMGVVLAENSLLSALINRSTRLAARSGEKSNYVYDLIAAMALAYPERFERTPAPLPHGDGTVRQLRLLPPYAGRKVPHTFA